MLSNRFRSAIFGAAISLGAALSCVAPAQAKVYIGAWDPSFGPSYPDLGWRGEATFSIPDPCRNQSDGWYTNLGSTCGGMSITNGLVELYSLSGVIPDAGSPIVPTLNFTGNPDLTLQMHVVNNEVVGVRGFIVLPEATPSVVGGVPAGQNFWLGFWSDTNSNTVVARLATCQFLIGNCDLNNSTGEGVAVVTMTPVPEPEAYVMALAALGVVGVMRRRRRK